jgi:hypothetical protein
MKGSRMGSVTRPYAHARPESPEKRAEKFLLGNPIRGYRFYEKRTGDGDGFDIWCCRPGGKRFRVEIKATDMAYSSSRKSDIRKQLYFSRDHEINLFQAGELKVVRVFLGGATPAVIMFDISIQRRDRKLKADPRAYLSGPLDYTKVEPLLPSDSTG